MMTLLFLLVSSQIDFTENNPIPLDVDRFQFEHVTVTPNGFLVCNQERGVVHLFDLNGRELARLGGKDGEEQLTLPSSATWMPSKNQYYVYDSASRSFTVFGADYQFVTTIPTDFPSFFEVGNMLGVEEGAVSPISLTQSRYLMGRFNKDFTQTKYGYELADPGLARLSPVLYQCFAVKADVFAKTQILVTQSLTPTLSIFDTDLNNVDSIPLEVSGWKNPNLGELAKVSKNPHALEEYRKNYSEVVSLHTLTGNLFVLGFRNVNWNSGYQFQCYDLTTGKAKGAHFTSSHPPVGTGFGRLYLRNKSTGMTLIPIEITTEGPDQIAAARH